MARILISMPDNFLKDIDKAAKKEQMNRSELIREALRSYIDKDILSHIINNRDTLIIPSK